MKEELSTIERAYQKYISKERLTWEEYSELFGESKEEHYGEEN